MCALRQRRRVVFLAGAFLAVEVRLAVVFFAGDFFAAEVRLAAVVDFLAVDFLAAVDFLGEVVFLVLVVRFAGDFFAAVDRFAVVDFLAVEDFFAAVDRFAAEDFLAAEDFFAAVDFLAAAFLVVDADPEVASFGGFFAPETTAFRSAPARKFGLAVFLARFRSPVCGLRTILEGMTFFSKAPKPVIATFSPLATSRVMVSRTESRACCAAFLFPSNCLDSASISWLLFTDFPFVNSDGSSRCPT